MLSQFDLEQKGYQNTSLLSSQKNYFPDFFCFAISEKLVIQAALRSLSCFEVFLPILTCAHSYRYRCFSVPGVLTPTIRKPTVTPRCCHQRSEHLQCVWMGRGEIRWWQFWQDDAFQHTQLDNSLRELYQAPSHQCDRGFLKSRSEAGTLKQPVFYGILVKPSVKKHRVGLSELHAGALP